MPRTCTMSSSALRTFNGCREQRVATATMPPAEAPAQRSGHIASHCNAAVLITYHTAALQTQHTCNRRVGIQQAQLLQDLCCSQLVRSSKRGSAEGHTQLAMSCRSQHGITTAVPVPAMLLLPVGFGAVLPHGAHVYGVNLLWFGVFWWRECGTVRLFVAFGRKNARA